MNISVALCALACGIACSVVLLHILVLSRHHEAAGPSLWQRREAKVYRLPTRRRAAHLRHCARETVYPRTEFAVMSMLSHSFHLYGVSAMKLATTVRRFTNADLIMLLVETKERNAKETAITRRQKAQLERSGWKTCTVPAIGGPPQTRERNRFLDALLYTKFTAWKFTEYEGVLFLDSDTLVVGDITPAFLDIAPLMRRTNKSLAAARDRPADATCRLGGAWNFFNAGVLLLIPDTQTFRALEHSIHHVAHDARYAEQDLLNVLYGPGNHEWLELPFVYNAIVVSKYCEPELWRENRDHIKIVHYTTTKGWTYSQHWDKLEDPFMCWWWDVQDLCMYWESVATAPLLGQGHSTT